MADASLFRLVFLPYCLQLQDDGMYLVLNRRYKPVGITRTDWVDYGEYPVRVRFKRKLSAAQVKALSARGSEDATCIYLYNDGCIPTDSAAHWQAYSARLQRLAGYTVEH